MSFFRITYFEHLPAVRLVYEDIFASEQDDAFDLDSRLFLDRMGGLEKLTALQLATVSSKVSD